MDTKDRRNVFSAYMIVIGITGLFFPGCVAGPQFDSYPTYVEFNERTEIGTTLFVLRATDNENPPNEMTFNTDSAETKEFVLINQTSKGSPATADITLKEKLDRELYEAGITLKFSLTDTRGNVILKTVHLYIIDVCDEPPKFDTLSYTLEINENEKEYIKIWSDGVYSCYFILPNVLAIIMLETNIKTPTIVFTKIHATDKDNGNFALVTYTMMPKAESEDWEKVYSQMFRIDPNGSVLLLQNLDYEKNSFYQFTVNATDPCNLTAADAADLIIKVKDVQDTPPFFTGLPYMSNIEEKNHSNTPLLQVTAFDGDRGIPNKMSYFINKRSGCNISADCNICDRLFQINNSTGEITITGDVDWAMQDVKNIFGICTITVEAKEVEKEHEAQKGNTSSSATVTITILDQNNHYPMFERKSYTAAVQENAAPNTALLLCEDTPDIKVFEEDKQGWVVEKDLKNQGGNTSSSTAAILRCGDESGIKVFDKDKQGINSTFFVTLSCGNEKNCITFGVVPSTEIIQEGVIIIRVNNKSLLDYEQKHNITITIVAKEKGNTSHSTTSTVMVLIGNENDFPPQFHNATYKTSISEEPRNGTFVINITATDHDQGKYGVVSYSLAGGNNLFSVNSKTGEIVTNCNPADLDREKLHELYLSLTATDGGGRFNQTLLTVNLLDTNDNTPQFQQDGYTAFLDENSSVYVNKPFVTVKATDGDQNGTENSNVSYKILNITDLESNFTIDKNTGEIRLVAELDYEALNDSLNGTIIMTVIAYDHGKNSLSSNATVTIIVQDMNDNAPKFRLDQYIGTIPENAKEGRYVGTVNATDADKTPRNSQISFAIATGGFDNFKINSSSGVVSVQTGARFDRDKISLYNLTIIAIDQGASPHTTATTLNVTITDVNNKPPYFKNNSYSVEILEDYDNKSTIITCDATDPDENFSLSYSIICIKGWDENGDKVNSYRIQMYFRIDENGSVYVNSELDRETVEKLEVILFVNDTKADENYVPQTATATLTVTLLDVNDNYPVFEGNATYYKTNVSENANNPTILMSVLATDKDENRTINYDISNSASNDDMNNTAFKIDATTGVLSKTGEVDREITPTVNLTVIATDNGYPPRRSHVIVLITILDFNDNSPQFTPHPDIYYVLENVNNGTTVATINATDADDGRNKELHYEIETAEKFPFKINETTGVISVCNNLDREGPQGPSIMLTILAKDNPIDSKLMRTNRTTITIVLNDTNDNPPHFPNQTLTTRIPRDTAVNNTIYTVTVTDADALENANVTFFIANDTSAAVYFDIINTGKNEGRVIISQSLLNLVGWLNITLTATDHGKSPLNSSETLYIDVLDVNLNAPKIGDVPGLIKVYECASMNTEIVKINATDQDKSSPNNKCHFSMSIIQPQNNTNFKINKDTGQVQVNASLNVNIISTYEVQIMATDLGTPNRTSSPVIMNIVVDDVNDQPPHFKEGHFFFSVQEGQENKTIGRAEATDQDITSLSCISFNDIRKDYAAYFEINEEGYVIAKKPLDRENKNQSIIKFSVKVRDCSVVVDVSHQCGNYTLNWNSSETANVTITVLDADDNPPQFTSHVLRVGMRRNTEPKKEIFDLKSYVTDEDLPQNGIDKWVFEMVSLNMAGPLDNLLRGQKWEQGCNKTLCVTGNGTVVNNMWYTQDMSGIFNLSILVRDGAGNDTANILIFLIADSQVLKMTLSGNRTTVALMKDTVLSACSNVTGKSFVYDNIEDHITDSGMVETTKTDLFFHIAEYENNIVLSADEAKRFLDGNADALYNVRFKYKIFSIESSLKSEIPENESSKTIYVMAAVIALLALVILIVGYMFFSSTSRYKRKLRAAMPMEKEMNILKKDDFGVPGSNMYANRENPLLKTEHAPPGYDEIDATSHNSLDENEVDDTKRDTPRDELEEREATLDMYGEDNYSPLTIDPLGAVLREHDAQKQAPIHIRNDSYEFVNNGYLHKSELETTEI